MALKWNDRTNSTLGKLYIFWKRDHKNVIFDDFSHTTMKTVSLIIPSIKTIITKMLDKTTFLRRNNMKVATYLRQNLRQKAIHLMSFSRYCNMNIPNGKTISKTICRIRAEVTKMLSSPLRLFLYSNWENF